MATTKQAGKKAKGRAAGSRRPKSAGDTKLDALKMKIALDVDQSDLDRLTGVAERIESAAKAIKEHKDPREKQLYRRVHVAVYDNYGTRITNESIDLLTDDSLQVTVNSSGVSRSVTTGSR